MNNTLIKSEVYNDQIQFSRIDDLNKSFWKPIKSENKENACSFLKIINRFTFPPTIYS